MRRKIKTRRRAVVVSVLSDLASSSPQQLQPRKRKRKRNEDVVEGRKRKDEVQRIRRERRIQEI